MMDPGAPFSTFQDEAFAALMDATKASSRLANEDVSFHRSFDSGFASAVDQCNTTILSMINSLLRNTTAGTDLDTPRLGDSDDIETHWKDIVEVVDFSLEKAVRILTSDLLIMEKVYVNWPRTHAWMNTPVPSRRKTPNHSPAHAKLM